MTETFTGIAALAMTGFMIAFVALMVFMALIQPLWCVVDCAVDNRRSAASKVVWIILLIVLYGLANWFYGAFAATGPALRRLTRLAWAFAILLVLAFAAMYYAHPEFRRGIDREWQHGRHLVVLADLPAHVTAGEGVHAR
jgi:hypothetical protein